MRNTTTFTIENDKGQVSIHLRELTVREVMDFGDAFGKGPLVQDLERFLPLVSNLTTNDLMDMTPGELEQVWTKFREVNAAFFRIAEALGFGRVVAAFLEQLRGELMGAALHAEPSSRA